MAVLKEVDLHFIASRPLTQTSNSRPHGLRASQSSESLTARIFSQNIHFGCQPSGNIHPDLPPYNARLLLKTTPRVGEYSADAEPTPAPGCSALTRSLPAPSYLASLETRNCLSLLVQTGSLHIAVEAVPSENSRAAGSNRDSTKAC